MLILLLPSLLGKGKIGPLAVSALQRAAQWLGWGALPVVLMGCLLGLGALSVLISRRLYLRAEF